MNEQTSIVTTDDHKENSVTYEEFYKSFQLFIDTKNSSSSLTTNNSSLSQTCTTLPFMIKSSSEAIYPVEKETEEMDI